MQTKRQAPGSNGQFYVHYFGKGEAAKIYEWLDARGYGNPQGLTPENYSFPVILWIGGGTISEQTSPVWRRWQLAASTRLASIR